jgi:hypothetical protein
MKRFEDKIRQARPDFDTREPDKDHLARFILKLEKDQSAYLKRRTPWYYTRAAAAVIILFAASFVVFNYYQQRTAEPEVREISYSSGIDEVMTYYDNLSQEKLAEIKNKAEGNENAGELVQFAYAKVDDIDSRLAAIEKEYMKNPDNEMLKAALINNRRKKAEIMQNILLKIDFANSQLY